jgi:lysophospholipase L1-like esterase
MYKKYLFLTLVIFLTSINASDTQANETPAVEDNQQYLSFLKETAANAVVNTKTRDEFNQRSWDFWAKHKLAYNLQPEKYQKEIILFHQNKRKFSQNTTIEVDRFEDSIKSFRRFDKRNTLPENPILFIGSSSIVYWETALSFPDLPVMNRGFGGASVAEIIHYYNDVIKKHSPSTLVIYSDIDVENGKSPTVAINAFKKLINMVKQDFPNAQILLVAMKPTLIDDFIGENVGKNKAITNARLLEYTKSDSNLHFIDITASMLDKAGNLRADVFLDDGMHLNSLGYTLWTPIFKKKIASINNL